MTADMDGAWPLPSNHSPDAGKMVGRIELLGPEPEDAPAQAFGIIDPDYARIFTQARIVAWQYGYACLAHGSFTRDLDLLLVPWADRHVPDAAGVVRRIADVCGLKVQGKPSDKPHGRKAWSLLLPGFAEVRWVDVSAITLMATSAWWIACDDRMPSEGDEVLVWVESAPGNGYPALDQWIDYREDPAGMGEPTASFGLMWRDNDASEVTHWMPRPAAPGALSASPPAPAVQPRLTVRVTSFPESNGKLNWTALLVRVGKWGGLVGSCGGITIDRGECWNRVAYEAERAKLLIGERDTEPDILDYGDDIKTPEEWAGEVRGAHGITGA